MASYQIPDSPTKIALKPVTEKGQPFQTGTARFTVTNTSGDSLNTRLSVTPKGDAKAEWFQVSGETERVFAPKQTQTITVDVKVPATVKDGEYKFSLQVLNVNITDDATESAVVTFATAAAAKPKPNLPLIIGIVAAVVVLIGAGLLTWYLLSSSKPEPPPKPEIKTAEVPDVVGKSFADAQKILADKKFASDQRAVIEGKAPGIVVAQEPPKGAQLALGGSVHLDVGKGVKVPDVRTKSVDAAHQQLIDAGFATVNVVDGAPTGALPNTIIAQSVQPGSSADPAAPVTLTRDPGVVVPDLSNRDISSVGSSFANFNVVITTVPQSGAVNQIIKTDPAPQTVVAKNSRLTVIVRVPLCLPPNCVIFHTLPYRDFMKQLPKTPGVVNP